MRCRPSLVRGRAAQVNPGGFTTPARRPSVPHRTAGCGKSSLRPLMAGSSPSLPDGSNPSAAIVQSASDVQCSRLLKTTESIDTSSAGGRFGISPVWSAHAEFEHNLIADRTRAGLAAARAGAAKVAVKPKMSKGDIKKCRRNVAESGHYQDRSGGAFWRFQVTLNAALQREGYPENPAQPEPSTRSE